MGHGDGHPHGWPHRHADDGRTDDQTYSTVELFAAYRSGYTARISVAPPHLTNHLRATSRAPGIIATAPAACIRARRGPYSCSSRLLQPDSVSLSTLPHMRNLPWISD